MFQYTLGKMKIWRETLRCSVRKESCGSSSSIMSSLGNSIDIESVSLCLETFQGGFLGFHDVPHTLLHELVNSLQSAHNPGIKGVSIGVSSVISEYMLDMPPVLQATDPTLQQEKFIQIKDNPWNSVGDSEKIQKSITACLAQEGFKLSMEINLDPVGRVFFFSKDKRQTNGDFRLPNISSENPEERDTVSVCRPSVVRTKSSFLRTCHGRSTPSKY